MFVRIDTGTVINTDKVAIVVRSSNSHIATVVMENGTEFHIKDNYIENLNEKLRMINQIADDQVYGDRYVRGPL